MTSRQLQQIEDIAEGRAAPKLTDETLEGLRAMIAERAEALAACQMLVTYHNTEGVKVEFCDALDAASDVLRKANGDTP